MSDGLRVLCFGGPLNEQVVKISPSWGNCFEAPIPERQSCSLVDSPPVTTAFRTARYDIERFGAVIDDEPMVWEVALVRGYPGQRVIDAANVVLALCRFPWAAWLQVEP